MISPEDNSGGDDSERRLDIDALLSEAEGLSKAKSVYEPFYQILREDGGMSDDEDEVADAALAADDPTKTVILSSPRRIYPLGQWRCVTSDGHVLKRVLMRGQDSYPGIVAYKGVRLLPFPVCDKCGFDTTLPQGAATPQDTSADTSRSDDTHNVDPYSAPPLCRKCSSELPLNGVFPSRAVSIPVPTVPDETSHQGDVATRGSVHKEEFPKGLPPPGATLFMRGSCRVYTSQGVKLLWSSLTEEVSVLLGGAECGADSENGKNQWPFSGCADPGLHTVLRTMMVGERALALYSDSYTSATRLTNEADNAEEKKKAMIEKGVNGLKVWRAGPPMQRRDDEDIYPEVKQLPPELQQSPSPGLTLSASSAQPTSASGYASSAGVQLAAPVSFPCPSAAAFAEYSSRREKGNSKQSRSVLDFLEVMYPLTHFPSIMTDLSYSQINTAIVSHQFLQESLWHQQQHPRSKLSHARYAFDGYFDSLNKVSMKLKPSPSTLASPDVQTDSQAPTEATQVDTAIDLHSVTKLSAAEMARQFPASAAALIVDEQAHAVCAEDLVCGALDISGPCVWEWDVTLTRWELPSKALFETPEIRKNSGKSTFSGSAASAALRSLIWHRRARAKQLCALGLVASGAAEWRRAIGLVQTQWLRATCPALVATPSDVSAHGSNKSEGRAVVDMGSIYLEEEEIIRNHAAIASNLCACLLRLGWSKLIPPLVTFLTGGADRNNLGNWEKIPWKLYEALARVPLSEHRDDEVMVLLDKLGASANYEVAKWRNMAEALQSVVKDSDSTQQASNAGADVSVDASIDSVSSQSVLYSTSPVAADQHWLPCDLSTTAGVHAGVQRQSLAAARCFGEKIGYFGSISTVSRSRGGGATEYWAKIYRDEGAEAYVMVRFSELVQLASTEASAVEANSAKVKKALLASLNRVRRANIEASTSGAAKQVVKKGFLLDNSGSIYGDKSEGKVPIKKWGKNERSTGLNGDSNVVSAQSTLAEDSLRGDGSASTGARHDNSWMKSLMSLFDALLICKRSKKS